MKSSHLPVFLTSCFIFLLFPASTNYRLDNWSIGGGGDDQAQSPNYKTETITDPTVGDPTQSTNYGVLPGLIATQMAARPPAPTVTNPSNWYDKLQIVINNGNNPSDTKFLIAFSPDNFITTYYVHSDNHFDTTTTLSDWRTYASWGGSSGTIVLGLQPSTSYTFEVKAAQGSFTESGWSPSNASATGLTGPPTISFDINIAPTYQITNPPYIVNLGDLTPGAVTTATDKIWLDFTTNADNGGVIYVEGTNNGLKSAVTNHTISAVSADLSSQTEGYGIQTDSLTQTDGGPLTADTPFNGSGNTVGSTGTLLIPLNTTLAPMDGGRSSQIVKATIGSVTPAATDYTETLTLVATGMF